MDRWVSRWVSVKASTIIYQSKTHIQTHILSRGCWPWLAFVPQGIHWNFFFFCYQVVCMYLFKLSSSSSSPGARALRSTQGGIGRHFSFTTTLTITAILQKSTRITTIKLRFTRFCLKTFYTVTFMLLHTRRTESSARGQVRINTYTYWWEELLI